MRLDLVVGPKGARKSTIVRLVIAPAFPNTVFVNADIIAVWPDDPAGHFYEAAEIAGATKAELIERRQPLIAETDFSHSSKLGLLRDAARAGYDTGLHVVAHPPCREISAGSS